MRLHVFYVGIATIFFACSNDINNTPQSKAQLSKTNKNDNQATATINPSPKSSSIDTNSSCSGKECDEQKDLDWNSRMMLW